MKKGLIALFLAVSTASFSLDAHLKLGVTSNAKEYNKEDKTFDKYSPMFGLEVTQTLLLADVGLGVAYNGKTTNMDIETIPAYGLIKMNLFPIGVKPYLVGKVGKVLYAKDKTGKAKDDGYYYGAGLGLNLLSLQGEIIYSVTEIKGNNSDKLEQVTLSVGYNFF